MNFLSGLISDKVTSALGWNIFHILWQGILIALFLALILRILKRNSAQVRYISSFLSLLLVLGLSIFNFYYGYNSQIVSITDFETLPSLSKSSNLSNINVDAATIRFKNRNIIQIMISLTGGVKKYFPAMVSFWLLGVFLFTVKFLFSFLYTNRLKTIKANEVPLIWKNKFQQIQEKLKLSKTVKYLESKLIKTPIVLGYLKPFIIVPFGMLSGMPSNQIEAIIAHELAHIRRNDYIINVIQTIIETVFFFHPAVWYISSQIRKERENCCDDIALTVCEGSLVFAKALVSVHELNLGKYYSAVAFASNNKHLLNRVKRTIMKQKDKSNYMDKIFASAIIISGVLALSFTYSSETSNNMPETGLKIAPVEILETPIVVAEPVVLKSTVFPKIHSEIKDTVKTRSHHKNCDLNINDNTVTKKYTDKKGKKKEIRFNLKNGKASDLYVDGKKIPENEYNKYQKEIDETVENLKEAKEDVKQALKDVEELDIKKIKLEVQEAMKNVHINMDEINEEIAHALVSIDEIDLKEIIEDVEVNLENLKDIDLDFDEEQLKIELQKVKEELTRVKESVKNEIDTEAIQKELQRIKEELSQINEEGVNFRMQESLKEIDEINKEEIEKDLQKKLEELEELELEKK